MAFSGSGAVSGAKKGTAVAPGLGTSIGAAVGGIFGGGGGGAPFQSGMADETAYATRDFKSMFGRDPTQAELAQIVPAYVGQDQHFPNQVQGKAFVAQLYQAQENTPDKQAARQSAQYTADAPKYYDQINGMFKQTLGRDATDAEKTHFGSLMASGNVDAYTVGQFLNALPENVQKQDAAFRTGLTGDLQKQDAQYYQQQILPSIQSQNTAAGRSTESSGYANALALAAQQQNTQREGFLSNLTAQQYAGSQGLAQDAYKSAYGGYQNLQDYSRQRSAQLTDAATNRVNDISNFNAQKQAYDDYLRRYGKKSNAGGIGALAGGIAGAAIGGYATGGNPAGISTGYQVGSGVGGGAGSFFG